MSTGAPTSTSRSTTATLGSRAMTRLEHAETIDHLTRPIRTGVLRVVPRGMRDLLHGPWFGHPVHPALVTWPLGSLGTASLLDAVPGVPQRAVDAAVVFGIAGTLPTIATGVTDWSQLEPRQQRVGTAHALANAAAVPFYVASLAADRRGHRIRGAALRLAGLATMALGGWLGGHLVYRQGAGTNHNQSADAIAPEGWQRIAGLDELPEGRPVRRELGRLTLAVVNDGGTIHALLDTCSHQAGPLSQGSLERGVDGATCLRCPWHDSVFRLADGAVVHGPTTAPQPVVETRVVGGLVEARWVH